MGKMPWAVFLWPGLPFLYRGQTLGLVVAAGAAAMLNLALLSSFVWIELLGQGLKVALWVSLAFAWGAAAWWAWSALRTVAASSPEPPAEQGFAAALHHYLRGDWFEAERLLAGLLARDEEDVESRLLLATLLRHRRRFDEALRHLEFLQGLEAAAAWHWEICRERQLMADAESRDETDYPSATEITPEAEQSDGERARASETSPVVGCLQNGDFALEHKAGACAACVDDEDCNVGSSRDEFGEEADESNRWGPTPKSLRVA